MREKVEKINDKDYNKIEIQNANYKNYNLAKIE